MPDARDRWPRQSARASETGNGGWLTQTRSVEDTGSQSSSSGFSRYFVQPSDVANESWWLREQNRIKRAVHPNNPKVSS